MTAAAGKVWLTFSGTVECPVPAECVFAADATQADILAAYYRFQHRPVPPGVWLCVRPSPDAPDSARRVVMPDIATASSIREYLALRYSEDAVLEALLPSPVTAHAPVGGAPAVPAPKRAREDDAAGNSVSAAVEAPAAKALAARAAQRAPPPGPAPSEDAGGAWPDDDDEAGPSAPPARVHAPRASPALAAPASAPAPATVARLRRAAAGAGGAQALAAAPAAPGTVSATVELTLQRTGVKYKSWAALRRFLRKHDVVVVVGVLPPPLHIDCGDVTVTGVSDAQHFTIPEWKGTTLKMQRSRIVVRYADIACPSDIHPEELRSAVLVQKRCNECTLDHCLINGKGERLLIEGDTKAEERFEGNHGVDTQNDVLDFKIKHVTIREVTGNGLLMRTRCTARLDHVRVYDSGATGFWLRGCGKCELLDCLARSCKVDGIYDDCLDICTFVRCVAELCWNNGAVFDFPSTVLHEIGDAAFTAKVKTLLASTPHNAPGLVCTDNGCNAAVVDGGVAVDLTNAALRNNDLNGLLVTGITLPGATAPITITGVEISGNGRGKEANAAEGETYGFAMGKNEHGVSRIAVMVPQGPPFVGVQFSNNRDGDFIKVADVEAVSMND